MGTLAGRLLAEAILSLPLRQGLSPREAITLHAATGLDDSALPLPCPIRARTHASCGFRTPRRLCSLRDVALLHRFLRAKNPQHHPQQGSQSTEDHQTRAEKQRHGQFHACLRQQSQSPIINQE